MARRRKNKKKILSKLLTIKFLGWVLMVLLLLGVIGLFFYQIYNADFFKINKKSCRYNLKIDKKIGNELEGKIIFNINLAKFHSYLKNKYPEYKNIKVIKKFPNIIEIQIEKRKPLAQIRAREFYLIDREAVVVSRGNQNYFSDFPIITTASFDKNLHKGSKVADLNLEDAFELIEIIKEKKILETINSLDQAYRFRLADINVVSSESIYFYLTNDKYSQNRIKIIISREEIAKKTDLLNKLIAQKLKDKLSLIRYIDFRFEKVAVGFKR